MTRGKNRNSAYITTGNETLCRNPHCTRKKSPGSDFCRLHEPQAPAPVDPKKLKRMMAGR